MLIGNKAMCRDYRKGAQETPSRGSQHRCGEKTKIQPAQRVDALLGDQGEKHWLENNRATARRLKRVRIYFNAKT